MLNDCRSSAFGAIGDGTFIAPEQPSPLGALHHLWRRQVPIHFSLGNIAPAFHLFAVPENEIPWPHAPVHRLSEAGTYFITAGTYGKLHHFRGPERLGMLQRSLLQVAHEFGWQLEAWAVFSNHYHFVGHSPHDEPGAGNLRAMLSALHSRTAGCVNRLDGALGRQVWHNFWDTRLTFQNSYLARLNYVHQNPVKHGLSLAANQYPWCSARWFERNASPATVKSIYRFRGEGVRVPDDFEPDKDWWAEFQIR